MTRLKAETERVNLYLTSEAAELLAQLAPSPNKRGQFVSDLIVAAATSQNGALRREVFQTAAELNTLANQLMALAGQHTRFIATRTAQDTGSDTE